MLKTSDQKVICYTAILMNFKKRTFNKAQRQRINKLRHDPNLFPEVKRKNNQLQKETTQRRFRL